MDITLPLALHEEMVLVLRGVAASPWFDPGVAHAVARVLAKLDALADVEVDGERRKVGAGEVPGF